MKKCHAKKKYLIIKLSHFVCPFPCENKMQLCVKAAEKPVFLQPCVKASFSAGANTAGFYEAFVKLFCSFWAAEKLAFFHKGCIRDSSFLYWPLLCEGI